MSPAASTGAGSRLSSVGTHALGGLLGGLVGGALVVVVTLLIKAGMDFTSSETTWMLIVMPLLGLALSTLVLQRFGRIGAVVTPGSPPARGWSLFRPGGVSADITGDVVSSAGREERFPWRQAPIRAVAMFATVGFGAAMGLEAPAAYLGVATGAALGDRGRWWRRLLRPAALGGGAAGVAALMGIPLVGTGYLLEIGRRNDAPLSLERVTAALVGGLVGWGIKVAFHLKLISLVVPQLAPSTFRQAAITALFIGALSGAITALAGSAIYRAKKWQASPATRFAVGGIVAAAAAIALVFIAAPSAAVGPGGGAISWAERASALPLTLLVVAILRAVATPAAVGAGGCGGVFVPFLAIGDIGGRVFAPALDIGEDLAGAAGAAAGIAGGYRLPFTAMAMVLGVGGPHRATLTCLATVVVAYLVGKGTRAIVDRFSDWRHSW